MRKKKEKCLFPKVSHFIFESFIYVTSLSGLIKGTANYTYQAFFRLWGSTRFSSCFLGEICVLTARLLPLLSVSGRTQRSQEDTSHPEPMVTGRNNTTGSSPSQGATEPARAFESGQESKYSIFFFIHF